MDFATNTEKSSCAELKISQENSLLQIIKELCSQSDTHLSPKLKIKVGRIVADCDLKNYTCLHKVSTADESTSTLLGLMSHAASELTFDEQAELNKAVIQVIEKKLPACIAELEHLQKSSENRNKLHKEHAKEMKERDSLMDTLQEQENEKMELMLEWINYRINGASNFSDNASELLALRNKILSLKSKIVHLQILQNIFTETNQSIKAYSELHKDLQDGLVESERRIKEFRAIIDSDDFH